jgi:(p)ppGpp synthase/HD superfamily hydrolase
MLLKALRFCDSKHEGQVRKVSNKPYASHPIHASYLLGKYKQSHRQEELIVVMLLHDTLEDTETTFLELASEFTPLVASLVLELTSCDHQIEQFGKNEYLKKKLVGMSSWGLVLKLVDRLSNVMDSPKMSYCENTLDLMNHLKANRKLTPTHKAIIIDILFVCNKLLKEMK